ncbi:hypothetical protein KR059_003249, partial [Drosophila kikkawai]
GFVRAKMAGWWMYSVYLAPSMTLAEFGDAVDRLVTDARGHTPSLIAGDFNAILTALDTRRAHPTPLPPPARRGYKADTLDIQSFAEHMQRLEANGCAEQIAESAMNQLQAACDNCMTAKRAHSRHRDSVYWWNHAIAAAR